jgi:hypothetical protein
MPVCRFWPDNKWPGICGCHLPELQWIACGLFMLFQSSAGRTRYHRRYADDHHHGEICRCRWNRSPTQSPSVSSGRGPSTHCAARLWSAPRGKAAQLKTSIWYGRSANVRPGHCRLRRWIKPATYYWARHADGLIPDNCYRHQPNQHGFQRRYPHCKIGPVHAWRIASCPPGDLLA